jgi:RNA polymerase sigma-70 factor, ECF subfamily
MEEAELNAAMDRYACGDQRAFGALHATLQPRLLAFLRRMTGSDAVAEDLTQETFLRMHRARSTFAQGGAVIPWAYAIARNVHLDHARAAKFRKTERLPSDPGREPVGSSGADVESAAIASEAARVVDRVLQGLPPAQREAFVMIRYEGLSVEEASQILGTTPTALKLRAFRAYEALRAALAENVARPAKSERKAGGRAPSSREEEGAS